MNENWKFSDIPYTSPDVEALQARYDALTRRAREAQSPEELVEIVRQRDALQQEVALCQSIATIRALQLGNRRLHRQKSQFSPFQPLQTSTQPRQLQAYCSSSAQVRAMAELELPAAG